MEWLGFFLNKFVSDPKINNSLDYLSHCVVTSFDAYVTTISNKYEFINCAVDYIRKAKGYVLHILHR